MTRHPLRTLARIYRRRTYVDETVSKRYYSRIENKSAALKIIFSRLGYYLTG